MIGMPDLTWYPKRNGAGDIDGAGSKRLLGQPDLDLVNLVLRETAQNSWDAKLDGKVPDYQLRIRRLDPDQMDVLYWNVFRRTAPESRLRVVLDKGELDAIEISDRNTSGLGGSLRNDVDTEGDHDWADFVLAVGAPPGKSAGGGTYGFGKTAAYSASKCSTILIWSAVPIPGGVEHRFIASAMDNGFSMDGERFTGRQWWGRVIHEDDRKRIEPVVGEDARRLGEALFERHFGPGETGTSLLILDPWPPESDLTLDAWVDRLPIAVMRNLWPKLIPGQPAERSMTVSLFNRGTGIELPLASVTFRALGQALEAVRLGKASAPEENLGHTVAITRYNQVIGHLALRRYFRDAKDPLAELSGRVCLMRAPELVVRAQDYPSENANEMLGWIGVFKPLDSLNASFAAAEPPAHDAWEPGSVRDTTQKSEVNLALKKTKDEVRRFLQPTRVPTSATEVAPTAAISSALAGLAGSALGTGASSTKGTGCGTKGRRAAKQAQPTITMDSVMPLPLTDSDLDAGRERSRFSFQVAGPAMPAAVEVARASIAIEGNGSVSDDDVALVQWSDGSSGEQMETACPSAGWCEIAHPAGVAIDVVVRVRGDQ